MREKLTRILLELDVYSCDECQNCDAFKYSLHCDDECFCRKVADWLIERNVVPVTRCNECVSCKEQDMFGVRTVQTCKDTLLVVKPDGYCYLGKQRGDTDDN